MNPAKPRNPPLPSPWTTRAPQGFRYLSRRHLRLPDVNMSLSATTSQNVKPRLQRHRNVLKESAFFRNLNKNTLVLSFPDVHPNQIDAALTLCDNDLSETIGLLQLRVRILRNRKLHMEKKNTNCNVPLVPIKSQPPPKVVKYIPTKYNDVHIVEVTNKNVNNNNQIKVMEVNKNVLQMLETCKTTMLLPQKKAPENTIQPITTHTVTSSTSNSRVSSEPEFSPATTSTSSVRSTDSNKLQVLTITKCPEMQPCVVVPPNKILERALTFCIPCSTDIYDFAEDEPVLYDLPKPSRKPVNKVGIVLKKSKSGLSVRLL